MYVRTKKYVVPAGSYCRDYGPFRLEHDLVILKFWLVETRRVAGKARQRTVAYLGSAPERNIVERFGGTLKALRRRLDEKLAELGIESSKAQCIRDRFASRFPLPTPEEAAVWNKQLEEVNAKIAGFAAQL